MSSGIDSVSSKIKMQRCLSHSLYWYVEKSMEDMLEGYMLLMTDKTLLNHNEAATEANRLITQMLELPLEFDSTSRQLAVTLTLGSIQRHINSPKACKYLLISMLNRKSEIAVVLKSDFLTLLEQVFFREVKKDEYMKPEVSVKDLLAPLKPKRSFSLVLEEPEPEKEQELHPKLECRAYAEILVELYQTGNVGATHVLVYLEQLSNLKEPSYYHTDLLLFLLSKIGRSVEDKLSRGNYILRNPSTPTSSSRSYAGGRATFDGIYLRLESLVPYAISAESKKAYAQIMEDRKPAKKRSGTKKTKSKERFRNGCVYRGHSHDFNNRLMLTPASSAEAIPQLHMDNMIDEEQAVTAL